MAFLRESLKNYVGSHLNMHTLALAKHFLGVVPTRDSCSQSVMRVTACECEHELHEPVRACTRVCSQSGPWYLLPVTVGGLSAVLA